MIKWKDLSISILIPIGLGLFGSLISDFNSFENIVKPFFMPPMIVFPIVWTILYILMGISSYIIYESDDLDKYSSLRLYAIQLIINSLWSFFFFTLNWFLFSFILVLVIISLVIVMTLKFYNINKLSGYLQIPYLFWLSFASVLSLSIYFLNL